MISQRFFNYYGKILNLLAFTRTMPFYFDHKTCRMRVLPKKQRKLVHGFILISVLYCAFSVYRLFTELHTTFKFDYVGLTLVTVWIMVYLWELILDACQEVKKYDMAWLFNQITDLDLTLTSKEYID